MVGQILAPLLVHNHLTFKPPRSDKATNLHRDNDFLHCRPGDGVLTAWVALDDVGEDNGCLPSSKAPTKRPRVL